MSKMNAVCFCSREFPFVKQSIWSPLVGRLCHLPVESTRRWLFSTASQCPVLPLTRVSVSLLIVCASGRGALARDRCLFRTKLISMALIDLGNDFSRRHFKNEDDNFHVVKIADILSRLPFLPSSLLLSFSPSWSPVCVFVCKGRAPVGGTCTCANACVYIH